jgi:uncharacterized RDD family membrane protein YckC
MEINPEPHSSDTDGQPIGVAAAAPRYVGFWARALASLIDSLLMLLLFLPLLYAFYGAELIARGGRLEGGADLLFNYVLPLILVLLFWFYRSATPGKIVLKAKIVDEDSLGKPRPWQWFVRYLGYYISLLALGMGFLWVAWDVRKQGFHDKLARTVVIYSN